MRLGGLGIRHYQGWVVVWISGDDYFCQLTNILDKNQPIHILLKICASPSIFFNGLGLSMQTILFN